MPVLVYLFALHISVFIVVYLFALHSSVIKLMHNEGISLMTITTTIPLITETQTMPMMYAWSASTGAIFAENKTSSEIYINKS